MDKKLYPTPVLGPEGWVESVPEKIALKFANLFTPDASQSVLYHGSVLSIQEIISRTPNNISAIEAALSSALTEYYKQEYEDAIVEVKDKSSPESAEASLSVDVKIKHNSNMYSLGASLMFADNSNIKYFIETVSGV